MATALAVTEKVEALRRRRALLGTHVGSITFDGDSQRANL